MNPEPTNQAPTPPITPPETTPAPAPAPVAQPIATPQATGIPGTGLSIAGFVVSLASLLLNFLALGIPAAVGLALSIIGRVKTKKAGKPSGLALAGIIISSITIAITVVYFVFGFIAGFQMATKCNEIGTGSFTVADERFACVDGKIVR